MSLAMSRIMAFQIVLVPTTQTSDTVIVVTTKTSRRRAPAGYDPSQFPAFAVTVDIVILTMSDSRPHVLLVSRGVAPFKGMWAIRGGFKRPGETLDQAAKRELAEETGVDSASLLTQFGAYGDPGRDPRMNVVTVAYLAVLRDVGAIVAGSDAGQAAPIPGGGAVDGKLELAVDHARVGRGAGERAPGAPGHTGNATAFVAPTVAHARPRAGVRAVFEGIWGVHVDGANFRRTVIAEDGWVIPTGRRARPGSRGGKPAELFRAGRMWKLGGPIRRSEPNERRKGGS